MFIIYLTFLLLLILILVWYFKYYSYEGFSNKQMISDIVKNKELFKDMSSYEQLKQKISWIDPIYYYDIKQLYKNKLDTDKEIETYIKYNSGK